MNLQIESQTFNLQESKRLATGIKSYEPDETIQAIQAIPLSHLI